MAGSAKQDNEPYDDINITPMVDLTFVLLIIFIIMTTAAAQGIQINLPQASSAPPLETPQTKAITVTSDGTIFLDVYPVTMAELETRLSGFYAADPNLPIVVKGDASVEYQRVVEVLDLCGRIGLTHIGLVTQKLVK